MDDQTSDALRSALAALDPLSPDAVDPITSIDARTLLETTMRATPDLPTAPDAAPTSPTRRWMALAAGIVVVAALGASAILFAGKDTPSSEVAAPTSAPEAEVLELDVAPFDAMAMCLALDPVILGEAPLAFGGAVETVDEGVVTLTADTWYAGDPIAMVSLAIPPGSSPALDGVDFVVGGRYLVSAVDGEVRTCGLSGPESPELLAAFEEAFSVE